MVPFLILALLSLVGWLVIFGVPSAAFFSLGTLGPAWLLVAAASCAAVGYISPVAGPIDRFFQRLKSLSPGVRNTGSMIAGCACTAFLSFTARSEHRQFFPYVHDEFSYLIQAHQFASGHLWMPAHPLAAFFDSFQLFASPVYASAYFPGTALLYVPGIWLHLPPYVTSLFIAGVVGGLLFWITAQLLDGVAAVLAVLLLLADGTYRELSIMTMGQIPLLLYGLLATVAWICWSNKCAAKKRKREGRREEDSGSTDPEQARGRRVSGLAVEIAWLIACGLCLGLAAVTRPVDSLCFAIPISVAVFARMPRQLPMLLIGAIPFLALQLTINHGITGQWLRTPFGLYTDLNYPGTGYGFHPYDPAAHPASDLPQKQALFHEYEPVRKEHTVTNVLSDLLRPHGPFNGARLRLALSQSAPAPFPFLSLLLPFSLLSLNRSRIVSLTPVPRFLFLYIPYLFFFPHYVMTVAPAVIIGLVAGARSLPQIWKAHRRKVEVGLTLFIAVVAIASFPQWAPWKEDMFNADLLASVNRKLAALPQQPAVVLFRYDPVRNTHEEPIYNADVAWPDDALIIRAHDRGPRNRAIFDYFSNSRPERMFYLFDEHDQSLRKLGFARALGTRASSPTR